MISLETINSALPLAQKLSESNVELGVKPDTPMQLITGCSLVFDDGLLKCNLPEAPVSLLTDQMRDEHVDNTDNVEHNTQMDALVAQLVEAVTSHLSFTRNEVLDNVNKYIARVKENPMLAVGSPTDAFNIVKLSPPVILYNDLLVGEINRNVGVTSHQLVGNAQLPYKTLQELVTLISTKNNSIDKAVYDRLYKRDPEILQKVWNTYFCSLSEVNYHNGETYDSPLEIMVTDPIVGADVATYAFLLARNIKSGSEASFEADKIEDILDIACSELLRVIDKDRKVDERGIVVVMNDEASKTVYVNTQPYMDWIRQGGKNEVLFGSLVKQLRLSTKDQLRERESDAMAGWSAYLSISSASYKSRQTKRFVDALRTEFYSLLTDYTETEKETFADSSHIDNVSRILEDELKHISTRDINNVEEICLMLMCRARYYYTDAFKILTDINTYTKENPQMSVKEAALAATINYVVDYISDQITHRYV